MIFETPLQLYHTAHLNGLQPALLESPLLGQHLGRYTFLGIKPSATLMVKKGICYYNHNPIGTAFDLLKYLHFSQPTKGFFPAWIGFLSYEYARYFGLQTQEPDKELPEAFFALYDEGYVWDKGQLISQPSSVKLSPTPVPPSFHSSPFLACNFTQADFLKAIESIKEGILNGVVYQVNLARQFRFNLGLNTPIQLYQRMRLHNPSPFMGILQTPTWSLLSGSPERLFRLHNGHIETRPIAGTRKRGSTPSRDQALEAELLSSLKENAEHNMLVDLLHNDMAKVAHHQSLRLSESLTVERYAHVMHLVSQIEGKTSASLAQIMTALFPGGTITGAPKETVMRAIATLEPDPRGAYTGSMGYVSSGMGADFNILIRSLYTTGKTARFSAGAGIVIDSHPEHEFAETGHKAKGILQALNPSSSKITHCTLAAQPRLTHVLNVQPSTPISLPHTHIAFIENHDSFSYNIVQKLMQLGARVTVLDHTHKPIQDTFTHYVLGPGPGEPTTSGRLMDWVEQGLSQKIPMLGICLGHQAIGLALGARLQKAPTPIHGQIHFLYHHQTRLFKNLEMPALFTRYHSLVLTDLPAALHLDAWTNTGEIMAIAHDNLPVFGVQFHPESCMSVQGQHLLSNFLTSL